jgi:hypothetical protein
MWMMGAETTSLRGGVEAHPQDPAQSTLRRVARAREAMVRRDAGRLMGLLPWRQCGTRIRFTITPLGDNGKRDR